MKKSNTPATHREMKIMQMVMMRFVHCSCWVQRNGTADENQRGMTEFFEALVFFLSQASVKRVFK